MIGFDANRRDKKWEKMAISGYMKTGNTLNLPKNILTLLYRVSSDVCMVGHPCCIVSAVMFVWLGILAVSCQQ